MKCVVILDNGHGIDTPGKCSPDRSLMEWEWTRDLAAIIVQMLMEQNIEWQLLVPEDNDVPLTKGLDSRVARANRLYAEANEAGKTAVLLSLHIDASPKGGWDDKASGFSVRVSENASQKSKDFARSVYEYVEKAGLQGNRCVPKEKYWVQNLGICRETKCPAMLGESLFQTNHNEVKFLLSDEGKMIIANVYVNGIKKYFDLYGYE